MSAWLALSLLSAAEDMGHHDRTYNFALIEADYSRFAGRNVINWDGEGWIGGDRHKFWWKSEGETKGARLEQVEAQALYSRNISTFFDAQIGVRYDAEPDRRGYAVIGVHGLAPYLLETEVHAFVGFKGDVSVRLKQSFDVRMTNRLVLQPVFETDFYLTDAKARLIDNGFSIVEAGVLGRYEISRKFAPYVGVIYERRLGGSADLARAAGEDVGGWSVRSGVRLWF